MIALNEVGGSPDRDGLSVAEFHAHCARMQAAHPFTMTTLSTHDTKRSDDVRARLAAITEIPGRWRTVLNRWSRKNRQFKRGQYPDRNTEYFLYQTLIGAWPIATDRLAAYMEKAAREAKQQTSWTQPNKEFEDALQSFIHSILAAADFVEEVEDVVAQVVMPGRINSLAQTLLNMTSPGVPDTYQGGELWDLHLVDPDNRGPVDYATRQAMLDELEQGMKVEEILKRMDTGMPKLWTIHSALKLRQEKPEWFGADAAYTPLDAKGPKSEHVIAFLRADDVAAIVPRWLIRLGGNWGSTTVELPQGRWKNVFTGDELSGGAQKMQKLLQRFPVALLVKEES